MKDRRIKFRGKTITTKEWICGSLIERPATSFIVTDSWLENDGEVVVDGAFVYPETVGQCTNIQDKTGKEIYEDDVLKYVDTDGSITLSRVKQTKYLEWMSGDILLSEIIPTNKIMIDDEIIGNIHDDAELEVLAI